MTSVGPVKPSERVALAIACFAFGIVIDFLFNAIFKIIWFVIYGVCYVTIGTTLGAYLTKTRFAKHTTLSMITMLLGALAAHLAMTGRQDVRTFSTKMVPSPFENAPIALKAPELAETLYVTSDKLLQRLSPSAPPAGPVPLTVRVTLQYFCVQKIYVDQIDGVEIDSDPSASWSWQIDRNSTNKEPLTLGWGDEKYFWCRKSE
jgi:hypothetical protein